MGISVILTLEACRINLNETQYVLIMLGGMLWNLPARSWEILAVQTTKELKPIVYIVDDQ